MKGKPWVLTAAAMVAGIRLWMQVRGKTKTPFAEWAVGWGALFMFLAIASEFVPDAAGPLAGLIVTADVLANGASLFEDVSSVVTGADAGSVLTAEPFAAAPAAATAKPKAS